MNDVARYLGEEHSIQKEQKVQDPEVGKSLAGKEE